MRRRLATSPPISPPRGNAGEDTATGTPELEAELAAFQAHLGRAGSRASSSWALLTALAWARGSGFPLGLWVAAASAVAASAVAGHQPGQPAITGTDALWLVRKARPWVATEARRGKPPVYRLRHEAPATLLRQQYAGEHGGGLAAGRIAAALLATVPVAASGERDWLSAGPYLRAHLGHHAAAAGPGALAALVRDTGFLAVADPDALSPLLGAVALAARDAVRSYRSARPMFGGDPRANAAHLAEANCGLTGSAGDSAADPGARSLYRTLLASIRRDDSLVTLAGHRGLVNMVCFGTVQRDGEAGGGRLLLASASDDGTVRVWDPLAGELACPPLTGHTDEVWSVAFGTCPDGRLLLASAGKDTTVRLWDPVTGAPAGDPITGHTERVYSVRFGTCPDGRLLLASGSADTTARLWDPLTGAQIGEPLAGHAGRVRSVAFGTVKGDGGRLLLASGSPDGPVRVWDPLTGTPVVTPLTGDSGHVYWVGFCEGPRDRLLLMTGGIDRTLRFWDALTGEALGAPYPMLTGPVNCLAFGSGADGEPLLACTSGDRTVHVWDPRDGTHEVARLINHAGRVEGLAFGTVKGDGVAGGGHPLLASASADQTVRIWDRFSGTPAEPGIPQSAWVSALALGRAPEGRLLLASASDQNVVRVWDPRAGALACGPLTGHSGWVDTVAFGTVKGEAGGGRLVLASAGGDKTSGDTTIRVWDPLTGELVTAPLTGHDEAVRAVAFGTTGKGLLLLASAGDDGTIQIWDPRTGERVVPPIAAHADGADTVAFTAAPGGALLLASGGGDGVVRLWDPLTGEPAGTPLSGHRDRVRSVAFGRQAGGRVLLASASDDHTVRVWQPFTGKPARRTLTGHTSWVSTVAFGAMKGEGGRLLLASGGGDKTVRIWDPVRGTCAVTINRKSVVRALAVTGLTLAVGQEEGFSVIELNPAAVQGA